jgi:uncharacterized protein
MQTFQWDPDKAKSNRQKHGVSFELAMRVFADPFCLTTQDRVENGEIRWQSLGLVEGVLVLIVAHTVKETDESGIEIIRIISARKAEPKERKRYEQSR